MVGDIMMFLSWDERMQPYGEFMGLRVFTRCRRLRLRVWGLVWFGLYDTSTIEFLKEGMDE